MLISDIVNPPHTTVETGHHCPTAPVPSRGWFGLIRQKPLHRGIAKISTKNVLTQTWTTESFVCFSLLKCDLLCCFIGQVLARRKEGSGKVKVLLHWTPEDMWVGLATIILHPLYIVLVIAYSTKKKNVTHDFYIRNSIHTLLNSGAKYEQAEIVFLETLWWTTSMAY